MMVRRLAWLACLCLLVPMAQLRAADVHVHASLDRDQVQMGDTVTLKLELDGRTDASSAPDTHALAADFRIVGTSRNVSLSIINGRRQASVTWDVTLMPKHTGALRIPPISIGAQRTQPLTLHVGAASPQGQGHAGDPVFVEVHPSTSDPYVGQQVDLAVRLFFRPNLSDGSLERPSVQGLQVRRLGSDDNYQTMRAGVPYHVVERHYALIAQHAGTLQIPGIGFSGTALDPDAFSSFMGGGSPVQARSPRITLHVKPVPAQAKGSAWLPARSLSLSLQGLPGDGSVQVGEPLTLTLTEQAVGLAFESLPEPALPDMAGAQVYPQPAHGQTDNDGHWLQGQRTRKFAIVPSAPGTLHIPALTLRWWNVTTDKPQTMRIPGHDIRVVAAAGTLPTGAGSAAAPARSASAAPAAAVTPAPASSSAVAVAAGRGRPDWMWMALGLLLLWLLTMAAGIWLWRRRRRGVGAPVPAPDPAAAERTPVPPAGRQHFLLAARRGDADAQAHALLAWARRERAQLAHLEALSQLLSDPGQRQAIADLQRLRFAGQGDAAAIGERLAQVFGKGFAWRERAPAQRDEEGLPPLYPFDIGDDRTS